MECVDPWQVIEERRLRPAALVHMLTNSQPWDNLKFDVAGVDEVRRKFFGTLYNTYSFFALYVMLTDFATPRRKSPFKIVRN